MMLVDSSMLMYRCLKKMDKILSNSSGVPTGLEYGTLRTLEMLEKRYPDHQIVLCLDDKSNWRKEINKEYKADRTPLDKDTYNRMDVFIDFLKCIYPTSISPNQEADDIMFALSRSQPGSHYIYTNDNDLLQAVCDARKIRVLKSWNSKLFEWTEEKVIKEYGVRPSRLAFYRAFLGDSSDNLKGVERIDKKLLASLINWCCSRGMSIDEMLKEIRTADWGSLKLITRVVGFINQNKWIDNYKLMKLCEDPSVEIVEPSQDDDQVVKCLKQWEIASLNLCKRFKDQLTDSLSEEF